MNRAFLFSLCLIWGLFHCELPVYAQEAQRANVDLRFERIMPEHGLPGNWVRAITQDQQGFMWFGTSDGLGKYDGHRFTV